MAFFVCKDCGYGSASWYGKCPDCGGWNTLVDKPEFNKNPSKKSESTRRITITPLNKITSKNQARIKTGLYELDRVLGSGFVPGEVILLTGEPGIGKSTLILQALKNINALYISGEESGEQVKSRADRLKINFDKFLFSNDLQVEGIIESVSNLEVKPEVIVIDSIQTIYSKAIEGAASGVSQLKEVTKLLVNFAKTNNLTVILIGHITKGGEIAGPKTVEHYVDCVLAFEGEKISNYRLIRASKNRFGSTDEIGIFEMTPSGLKEVSNPLVFLENEKNLIAGKSVVGVTEGQRSLFFEIQTLVVPTALAIPRRIVKGLDFNKVQLLLAVVTKFLNLPLDRFDIYVNVIGGVTIKNTASDLGLIASLISSFKNTPLPKNTIFIGEVGLQGEVRKAIAEEKIITEARRLGFKKIFSSKMMKNIKELKTLI
ncbi:MAG: repair protein radA protein [Candidatus Roizmanbacteria bacterium GW2011_GWA2_35_8]|uniref:DNA repair protein RadA n=1 Tax=Candidatus Roizmanbacteria bacterium GW2011_GWA2_35_8 TaxID=1618479 RepID=A0A0G0DEU1_9BACT|nr:MAG: repair protein radA protein [Candidatus Roizmanbacteria bacterium GW2011_GWA2_35_8]